MINPAAFKGWLGCVLTVSLLAVSCTGPGTSAPLSEPTIAATPSATPHLLPTTTPRTTELPTITITGNIESVSASTGIVSLAPPVHGLSVVNTTGTTVVLAKDGRSILAVANLQPGMTIQVTGPADGQGGVIAQKIKVIK